MTVDDPRLPQVLMLLSEGTRVEDGKLFAKFKVPSRLAKLTNPKHSEILCVCENYGDEWRMLAIIQESPMRIDFDNPIATFKKAS